LVRIVKSHKAQQPLSHAEYLLYFARRDQFLRPSVHFWLELLSTRIDHTERREVIFLYVWIVDPTNKHGWNEFEMRDAFALNQWKHIGWSSRIANDETCSAIQKALNTWTREWEVMCHRQNDQERITGSDIVDRDGSFCIVNVIIMRARNKLWNACRAPGELEQSWLSRVNHQFGQSLWRKSTFSWADCGENS